jgi:hypothetical protein
MELLEVAAEDVDALVDPWYSLASAMEEYDELNELSWADATEVACEWRNEGARPVL